MHMVTAQRPPEAATQQCAQRRGRQRRGGRTAPGPVLVAGTRLPRPAEVTGNLKGGGRGGQRTRPYQTLLVQILSSRTTEPLFGECQILPLPA